MLKYVLATVSLGAASLAAFSASAGVQGTSIQHIEQDNGDSHFSIRSPKLDMRANWRGDVQLNERATGFDALDGRVEIEQTIDGDRYRVVFLGEDGAVEQIYSVNDRPREIDADAAATIETMVRRMVLETGFAAEQRVASLYAGGGAGAVFREIDEITVDHAIRKYLVALAETARLNDRDLETYAAYAGEVDSDNAQRKVIAAIFETQHDLSPAGRAIMLQAANGIGSDHEMRKLLEAAATGELIPEASETALALLAKIDGDHDFRQGAEVLLENTSFDEAGRVQLLQLSAAEVGSDHELRKILEVAAERSGGNEAVIGALVGAVDAIGSDHEARTAIQSVAAAMTGTSSHWPALIAATAGLGSDHEKRVALEEIADAMPRSPALLEQFRAAVRSIGSSHERGNALESIQ